MEKERPNNRIKDYLLFPFRLMIRPFKGFDNIKREDEIHISLAVIFVVLFGILSIIEFQYMGFIVNTNNPYNLNALTLLVVSVIPIVIGIAANWAITTFIDGKGTFRDIFYVVAYSLVPIIIARILRVILSNFITIEDKMFLDVIFYIGLIWTVALLFVGMVIVHEYSFGLNIVNIILTAIAYAVIVFLILLFFNLLQQLFGFGESLLSEIIYRIRGR